MDAVQVRNIAGEKESQVSSGLVDVEENAASSSKEPSHSNPRGVPATAWIDSHVSILECMPLDSLFPLPS